MRAWWTNRHRRPAIASRPRARAPTKAARIVRSGSSGGLYAWLGPSVCASRDLYAQNCSGPVGVSRPLSRFIGRRCQRKRVDSSVLVRELERGRKPAANDRNAFASNSCLIRTVPIPTVPGCAHRCCLRECGVRNRPRDSDGVNSRPCSHPATRGLPLYGSNDFARPRRGRRTDSRFDSQASPVVLRINPWGKPGAGRRTRCCPSPRLTGNCRFSLPSSRSGARSWRGRPGRSTSTPPNAPCRRRGLARE